MRGLFVVGFRLSAPAEADLDRILDWSEERFHAVGRMRYAALLVQAMQDLADDPQREGVEWVMTSKRAGRRLSCLAQPGPWL